MQINLCKKRRDIKSLKDFKNRTQHFYIKKNSIKAPNISII